MRRIVLLVALGIASNAAASEPAALTFDDIVQRAAPDPMRLAREAGLKRFERELAATGRFAREGPNLDAEVGPRRTEDGARKLEASARIEVPILSGSRARANADSRLKSARSDILAAEAVESRLRLRAAYLDAWFEQERLKLLKAQAETIEQLVASVRKRVEEGADAPYEAALVQGELERSRSESDGARTALGDAWSALRALSDLPADPQALAPPGAPDLTVPDGIESRFEAGVLRRAVAQRGSLETAFVDLDLAQRRSRWSAAATIAKEANESYATIGAAYRFPRRGENDAWGRERAATAATIDRGSVVDAARLATRFATVVERARRFGPIDSPDEFEGALHAVTLRMELGKERPSLALPVRRQLLEAQGAALHRIRDGHLLIAEIGALTAGEAP
jgi:outer membrane efflux protein